MGTLLVVAGRGKRSGGRDCQTSTVFYMSGHLSSVTIEDWFLTRWERV